MKFACLGFMDEKRWYAMSESERNEMVEECLAYDEQMYKNKQWIAGRGEALQSVRNAKTVRWQSGKAVVTDGPYAETKEQLGGLGMLEARDMDHAVEIMSKHPAVRLGGTFFEIRPVDAEFNKFMESKLNLPKPTKIFVNLPVKSLPKSVEFFTKLGYAFNPQFTDETATCMIVSEDIYVMLLTEEKFKQFTPKSICDSTKSSEVLIALSLSSREAVNDMVSKAVAAGGTIYAEAKDYGFMLQHGYQDLDGHIWELVYMDPSAVQK